MARGKFDNEKNCDKFGWADRVDGFNLMKRERSFPGRFVKASISAGSIWVTVCQAVSACVGDQDAPVSERDFLGDPIRLWG
jgi:hypothetical protein